MTMRRRIEVNLEELDQIIDRSTQAPLSESDGQKLKTAIHAMAERWSSKRNKTEYGKDQCSFGARCGSRQAASQ
jgi:hypothetical protein